MLERTPAESVVKISIGRIEVRTGAVPAKDTPARTPRPEPVLMSLDDYLDHRSREG
ncbi:hypothetical protein [Halomonas sp. BM-2019]|uniref:hypothetical protein n=1 Tax=Halomonas sp. BM-2019 TaxID=2811227 RepID=UPI001B3C1DF0|nr:MAG: hypothetical protein J5F18_18960 [Halomonas sp. BM-2019]